MEMTELVRRAQTGDQEAMGELYQQTNKQIYALALRLTGRPELAMDVVQDTYLSAMQNLEKLRDPQALTHWLAQIAANRCRKLLRKEGRYVSPQQDEEDTSFFDAIPDPDEKLIPETAADDGETRRLLRELIDDLPEAQRECMILFYFSQCPVEQIAQVQECSEGTVKSRLNYGRKKLKEGILALEARDGIRLHSLAPVGLLFRLTAGELPSSQALFQAWQSVASQLGTAGAAGAGVAAAASGGGSAAAGGAAAVKGTVAGALKIKIAAMVAAGVVAVGGTAAMLHQPAVTFSDPAFEHNIRILLDQPEGDIHEKDLEQIRSLYVVEDGMAISWGQGAYPEAEEGTTAVESLEDISLLKGLGSLEYFVTDNGALLETVGEHKNLKIFCNYRWEEPGAYLNDLSFLEQFPNLDTLSVLVASETDLTPVETKTSLSSLNVQTDGDNLLDISQLTGLHNLCLSADQNGAIKAESSAQLPQLRSLELWGGLGGPPVLGLVEQMPGLEFLKAIWLPDTDLTPLAGLANLRAVILYDDVPYDLTPLTACTKLEICCLSSNNPAVVPSGLPVVKGDSGDWAPAYDILAEVQGRTS